MRYFASLFLVFFLAACASAKPVLTSAPPAASTPLTSATIKAPTNTPDTALLSTLQAMGAPIIVTFDGKGCTMGGPAEVTTAEQVVVFRNLSGQFAGSFVSRHYPGKTWQDVLQDIGTPGTYSEIPQGIALLSWTRSVKADEQTTYMLYTLQIEGEYDIVIEEHPGAGKTGLIWPCGPFQVTDLQ